MNTLCKCGCGKIPKLRNKYIHGHHRRGKPGSMKGKHHTENTKKTISKKASISMKKLWQDPEFRRKKCEAKIGNQNALGFQYSKKAKRKKSVIAKKQWQNPEYREKQLKAILTGNRDKPTKPERRLRNGLNKMFPNEYKFVGDGKIWIGYKNPDFINVNGQKKIIEMFGNFWHGEKYRLLTFNDNSSNKKHEQQRIKHFARYGFKALIVWENELKNIKQLKKKLIKFHNE